jgi:hypothetical protein
MSTEQAGDREPDTSAHHALLCETVARHFPEARIEGHEIELGFGDLRIACRVDSVHEIGAVRSASLFFELRGGRLGTARVFASVSGYADSAAKAIITGACNWTCTYGPVLRAGLCARPARGSSGTRVDARPPA